MVINYTPSDRFFDAGSTSHVLLGVCQNWPTLSSEDWRNSEQSLQLPGSDRPKGEYLAAPDFIGDFASLLTTRPKDGYQNASILTAIVDPLSRGTVALASASTDDLLFIDPDWLTPPTDQAVAKAAYECIREAFSSDAMKPVLVWGQSFPVPEVQTDAQVPEVVHKTAHTVWYAACTYKMGRASDLLLPAGRPQSKDSALADTIADVVKAVGRGEVEFCRG
ncbi:MAG: hypothetical protein M1814_005093 [Vezdaea aestivalis]|nr:MAG: hypothetical protein M1814_005093 [Vezdaea aestivalis]